ncbi:hypothetical protein OQA88_1896 [Cercophora sp. LCS_1]
MSARTGTALGGLKLFIRAIQFLCAAIVLALFSYFLATLSNHGLPTANWIRAVEGISGIAVLYTLLCILSLCCLSATGVHPATSLLTMGLDVAFAAAFIYVAAANKTGSGSCRGEVDTPFGTGDADTGKVEGSGGFFFIFSIIAEWLLIRHRRKENRYGPSPMNDYTEGTAPKKGGFFSMLFGKNKKTKEDATDPANVLPTHPQPDELRNSYATDQTRVGAAGAGYEAPKYESMRYEGVENGIVANGQQQQQQQQQQRESGWDDVPLAQYPPANYRYSDGVYERV